MDTLDGADVPTAVALLRQLATARPLRDFRGFDLFDADEDLADRASEILRAGLGGTTRAQEGGAHTA